MELELLPNISREDQIQVWREYNTNCSPTHDIAHYMSLKIEDVNKITDNFTKFSKVAKGEKNGLCNRSACQTPDDVVFYNKGTHKYYCPHCANAINRANGQRASDIADLERLFGEGTRHLCLTDDNLTPYEFWDKQRAERRKERVEHGLSRDKDNSYGTRKVRVP